MYKGWRWSCPQAHAYVLFYKIYGLTMSIKYPQSLRNTLGMTVEKVYACREGSYITDDQNGGPSICADLEVVVSEGLSPGKCKLISFT